MSNTRTIYFILHSRYPAEKAASLFAAKSCEAFAKADERVVLLVPRRFGRAPKDPFTYYGIERNFTIVYLPVVDLFTIPIVKKVAFYVSFFTFSVAVWWYLFRHAGEQDVMYSNESLSLWMASFISKRCVYEMHDYPEHKQGLYRRMLRRCSRVLVTNTWKMGRLYTDMPEVVERAFLEQNAVDLAEFPLIEKREARTRLGLPLDADVVVYTGHLYAWKGVDTLAQAAGTLPVGTLVYFVGGTEADLKRFAEAYRNVPNIHLLGHRPHVEVPYWQAAADVLVLPNTGKETIAKYYTSPMKLFEYMASGRPIVASDLPSIRELLNEHNAALVSPDDAQALAAGVCAMFADPVHANALAQAARVDVETHTWDKRARRILDQMR